MKKAASVGVAVSTAIWLSGAAAIVPVAGAQTLTVEQLQAQINQLLALISQLQGQLAAQTGGTTGGAVAVSCSFTRDLTLGSTGDDVKCLQQTLNANGYQVSASGAGSPGNESSYFGPATRAALAKWQAAKGVTPSVGYFGPLTRNAIASAVVVPTTPGTTTPGTTTPPPANVVIPSSGIAVTLAADNAGAGAVPKGASGVKFLKFNVAGTGTLDSLVFKREGIGATTDFVSGSFNLMQGDTRLTSGKTLNSTTHEVSFPGLKLTLNNEVKTLTLIADIAAGSTTGNRNYMKLVSGEGTPAAPTITGVTGNLMEIAGQTVGGLDPTSGAAPANPRIGQKEALLQEIIFTASSTEDVIIEKIAVVETGTIQNEHLSNFKLKVNDETIGTADSIGTKDLITFVLSKPYTIEKGQQRTFKIYGDISGKARANDTIIIRFDTSSDIRAIGKQYGYPVLPTIGGLDADGDADTLTISGGQVTITFNGPIAGDVSLRGQDQTVFDFTLASQNEVEIKNLRFHATTTGLESGEGFMDMKVWDVEKNAVVTSATDVTISTDVTFTDVINMAAGESRRFKVTVDVDADNDDGDDILVSLLAFVSGDIKNLDNNTNVATSDIVPNSTIAGNVQDTRVPTVTVQLASTPTSQTYVRGTQKVPLVGFSFRATGGDVKITSIKTTSTAGSGTLGTGEVQSLALYDGETRVSDTKSLDTDLSTTFSNLNITLKKGETKVLTLKGNIDANATNGDTWRFGLVNSNSTYITATDVDGNSATISGPSGINTTTASVVVTVADVGSITVAKAPDDEDSEAGIVIAGREQTLAKFRFSATNEEMTVNDMQLLVVTSSSATATSTGAADEVPRVKLYDGATQIGTADGYPVTGSGDNSGVVFVDDLGWKVPKNGSKTLTVKGALNTNSGGADSGETVFVSVMAAGFDSQGATAKDTSITAATGNRKVVYKTKPTISLPTQSYNLRSGNAQPVFAFKIDADSAEQISWKKIQLNVAMTDATMSSLSSVPGTTGTITIKRIAPSVSSNLDIASAISGNAVASTTAQNATITGGNSGYVTIILTTAEEIAAGSSKTYEVALPFADLSTAAGASPNASVRLFLTESAVITATTVNGAETSTHDGQPSFIWSDHSVTDTAHSETTADWFNGYYVKDLPSAYKTVSK